MPSAPSLITSSADHSLNLPQILLLGATITRPRSSSDRVRRVFWMAADSSVQYRARSPSVFAAQLTDSDEEAIERDLRRLAQRDHSSRITVPLMQRHTPRERLLYFLNLS